LTKQEDAKDHKIIAFEAKIQQKNEVVVELLHEHWHIDISYLNICGTFYFMCSILDGCSRNHQSPSDPVAWLLTSNLKPTPGFSPEGDT
jgi:hypothetical protein